MLDYVSIIQQVIISDKNNFTFVFSPTKPTFTNANTLVKKGNFCWEN